MKQTSSNSQCPRCRQALHCGIKEGHCWCQSRESLQTSFPAPPGQTLACLCPTCLDSLLAEQARAKSVSP